MVADGVLVQNKSSYKLGAKAKKAPKKKAAAPKKALAPDDLPGGWKNRAGKASIIEGALHIESKGADSFLGVGAGLTAPAEEGGPAGLLWVRQGVIALENSFNRVGLDQLFDLGRGHRPGLGVGKHGMRGNARWLRGGRIGHRRKAAYPFRHRGQRLSTAASSRR